MLRALCSHKVADRDTPEKRINMLGLRKTTDWLATVNEVKLYGHVLRRDDDSVLMVAVDLEVSGKTKQG